MPLTQYIEYSKKARFSHGCERTLLLASRGEERECGGRLHCPVPQRHPADRGKVWCKRVDEKPADTHGRETPLPWSPHERRKPRHDGRRAHRASLHDQQLRCHTPRQRRQRKRKLTSSSHKADAPRRRNSGGFHIMLLAVRYSGRYRAVRTV